MTKNDSSVLKSNLVHQQNNYQHLVYQPVYQT